MPNKLCIIIRRSTEDGPMWVSRIDGWRTDDWREAKLFRLGSKLPFGRPFRLRKRQLKQLDVVRFANRSRRQLKRRNELYYRMVEFAEL